MKNLSTSKLVKYIFLFKITKPSGSQRAGHSRIGVTCVPEQQLVDVPRQPPSVQTKNCVY